MVRHDIAVFGDKKTRTDNAVGVPRSVFDRYTAVDPHRHRRIDAIGDRFRKTALIDRKTGNAGCAQCAQFAFAHAAAQNGCRTDCGKRAVIFQSGQIVF